MQEDLKIWFEGLQVTDIKGCQMNPVAGIMLRNNSRLFRIEGIWHQADGRSAIELQEVKQVEEMITPGMMDLVLKPVENGLRTIPYKEFLELMGDGRLRYN